MLPYVIKEETIFYSEDEDILDLYVDDFKKVKEVSFCWRFDKSIDKLPDNIELIRFEDIFRNEDSFFNQKVEKLPRNLKCIIFSDYFNQPLDNLPSGLLELNLKFCYDFNHPLDFLPDSLNKLIIGIGFNQPLDNLPRGLKHLLIQSECYSNPLDNLPQNLEILELEIYDYQYELNNLPENIKYIIILCHYKHIDKLFRKYGTERVSYYESNF